MAVKAKKIIRTALQTTLLMAPPLFPSLQKTFRAKPESAVCVDFSLVDDARILELNRDYRGKNQPTDVLSFALWEENPDQENVAFPGFDLEIALGDIVISTQTAARQASEQGHTFEREIAFLTIHGALHLLGYDHGRDHARRVMFARQNEIFEAVFGGR